MNECCLDGGMLWLFNKCLQHAISSPGLVLYRKQIKKAKYLETEVLIMNIGSSQCNM